MAFFELQVLPILKANCTPCHDETTRTSGFSIQTIESVIIGGNRRGAAVKAGLPAESPLLQLLRGQLKPQMPLGKTFFSPRFGMVADRFGVSWMILVEHK